MAYDKILTRTGVEQTIPEEISNIFLKNVETESVVLNSNARKVPMSAKQTRLPISATQAEAEFVDGDTGLKSTTDFSFGKKQLIVEEIAAIVVIPDAVSDDSDFDLWGYAEAQLKGAVSRKVDRSVLIEHNRATWPTALIPAAVAAGNVVTLGTNAANKGGAAADMGDLFAAVEDGGNDVADVIASRRLKGALRQARNANGTKLAEVTPTEAYGTSIQYASSKLWTPGNEQPIAVAGDMSNVVIGLRQDVTFKVFDSGVISDEDGKVLVNLMQQDSKAMRVVFRFAFQVDDTNGDLKEDGVTREYPFAVLKSAAAPVTP